MIVVACADVGPARYLTCLAGALPDDSVWVGSKLTSPLFEAAGMRQGGLVSIGEGSSLVLTGTHLGGGIDRDAIRAARRLDVPSVSIVEHWTWMRERFDQAGEFLLPDFVFVNDAIARESAVAAGIPDEIIRIVGNPVMEGLPSPPSSVSRLPVPGAEKRVLFVSERVRDDVVSGTLPDPGFDEYQVIAELADLLGPQGHVTVKLHPVESDEKYAYLGSQVTVTRELNLDSVASDFDAVIGMNSMLLLELSSRHGRVITYRPGAPDTFVGARLGVIREAKSDRELGQALVADGPAGPALCEVFTGSRQRILLALDEVMNP